MPRDRVGYALVEHLVRHWEDDPRLKILLCAAVTDATAPLRLLMRILHHISVWE
ncbi:MAG: hypothetical protein L0H84_18880 [Pseudonocardia sp.]|nr:hypothetical protein [Pseudonocardia sp.]